MFLFQLPLCQAPLDKLKELIEKVKQINQTITHLIQEYENDVIHRILLEEISEQGDSIGPNVRKHLLQQVSAHL